MPCGVGTGVSGWRPIFWTKRVITTASIACALLLLTTAAAGARMRRAAPVHVRIVAYVGQPLEGARPDFTWTVSYKGQRFQLYVLNLQVLGGSLTPLDINAFVAPYTVKFQLAGEKGALQRFMAAPPRQQVLIMGYMRLDATASFLMLDTVDAAYLPTPSPTP